MVFASDKHTTTQKPARSIIRKDFPVLIIVFSLLLFFCPAPAFPNGTETLITTDTVGFPDSTPALYGDFIVCLDSQYVLNVYNLASGEMFSLIPEDPLFAPAQPAIFQDTLLWQEWDGSGSARIVRYDIPGRMIQDEYEAAHLPYEEDTFPKIHGNTIVWQNYNVTYSNWDVAVVRDGSSGPELILDGAGNQKHPSVFGNIVVYENWTDAEHAHVWQFNLTDNTSAPVFESSDQELFPQVSADRIVWQARNLSDTDPHIDIWENSVLKRLSPPDVRQEKPSMSGNRIVVEDYRGDSSLPDVYVYTASPDWTETWVSPNDLGASQSAPAIWDNRIVWEDTRSGNICGGCDSDIFLLTLGSSDTCPVADFSPSVNAGPDPVTATFTDHSAGSPIMYRIWNYSDGMTRSPMDPAGQAFFGAGIYRTQLTVGNAKCRNMTPANAKYDIYVDTPPDADFTAAPGAGFAPLPVQFTDISGGEPASWTWDFGDGSVSHEQNPGHTYTAAGQTYTVTLTVNNTFAGMTPDSEIKTEYIRTFLGATGTSETPVPGITVIRRFGGWFLVYNATMLPDMAITDPAVLSTFNPGPAGWQNITFVSSDAIGFRDTFGNNTYMGNLSQVVFQTGDVVATGMSPSLGTGWGVNYRLHTVNYPASATISTEIWENTTADDASNFRLIVTGSNYIETGNGIAYTARIRKTGIRGNGNATINMSVDRLWIGGQEAETFIIGYGVNAQGDTVGIVTPARFLSDDGTLDYFEAEVPEYITTFGIAPLSGSGNPFQLITLSVTSHASQPPQASQPADSDFSDLSTGGGKGSGQAVAVITAAPTVTRTEAPIDPGKSAKVYTNPRGVVTQATKLQSTDGRAVLSLAEGVTAMDAGGKPLTEITIKALPAGSLPVIPSGSTFTFAGMAYEIGPDGATFSPPVTLTFTFPQVQWGQDYSVKFFDQKSGTWQDLPVTIDAATGTVTVEVPHLCIFALFSQPRAGPPTPVAAPLPVPPASEVKARPPTSAVSIFISMMGWIAELLANNVIVLVIIIVLVIAVYVAMKRRSPGFGR